MPYTNNVSQELAIVGKVDPQSTVTALDTDAIELGKYRRIMFIVQVGALGSSATADFKVRASTASGGTYYDVNATDAGITQLTKVGTDDNKIAVLEVRAEKIAALNLGYTYLKGRVTVGTAASLVSVVALGAVARHLPASGGNLAAVKEIKVY